MWRSEIVKTLFMDIMPLKRRGLTFTWKSLDELRARLVGATVYVCGPEQTDITTTSSDGSVHHPSLFNENGEIIPLPQVEMLIEYTHEDGSRRAALFTDRGQQGTRIYIFRFNEARGRWMWPFIGMNYGPTFNENGTIAVYEPTVLSKTPSTTKSAMVKEHARDTGPAIAFLELIRQGKIASENAPGRNAAEIDAGKSGRVSSPVPPSMARASRTHHENAPTGKGSHSA